MEPLSITCDTCRSRLKVRDPAAIGQILSCPKCQSMVLVEAPKGWSSDTSADTAEGGAEAAAPPLPGRHAEASTPADSFEDDGLFDEALAETNPSSDTSAVAESSAEAEQQGELPELAMPATASPWTRLMASSVGRWSIFGGGAAALILVGVIGWSVLGGDENGEQVAQQEQAVPDAVDQLSTDESPKAEGADDKTPQTDEGEPKAETPDNPFAKKPSSDPIEAPTDDKPEPRNPLPFDNGPTDANPKKPEPEKADPLAPIVDPDEADTEERGEPPVAESSTDLLAGMDLLDEGELFGIGSGFGLPGEPEKPQDEPEQPIEQSPANDDPEDAGEPRARADLPEV
ncbi:MAG: hypothetical protein MI757_20475, partial [Pirellulales bacterium]|nr:hypothetical protein [Pirellulales bacterium]